MLWDSMINYVELSMGAPYYFLNRKSGGGLSNPSNFLRDFINGHVPSVPVISFSHIDLSENNEHFRSINMVFIVCLMKSFCRIFMLFLDSIIKFSFQGFYECSLVTPVAT